MKWVHEIASANQDVRREGLVAILRQEGLPYVAHHELFRGHWVDNIVIPVNTNATCERMIIGAHYDSVEGSTGANDNAAAVSVLIKLAKELIDRDDIALDIVFFDKEEGGDRGSERYIEMITPNRINAMINLDMCGYGDCLAIAVKGHRNNPCFASFLGVEMLKKYPIYILDGLPEGDDAEFEKHGIPNMSIAVLPRHDVDILIELMPVLTGKVEATQAHQELIETMLVVKTMHNAELDAIDIVQESAMELVYSYLHDCFFE